MEAQFPDCRYWALHNRGRTCPDAASVARPGTRRLPTAYRPRRFPARGRLGVGGPAAPRRSLRSAHPARMDRPAQILDLGVRSRRIPNNQAKGVELPALPTKSERDDTRCLDEREVWLLADAAGINALSILVLAWCGLRFGELAALRCGSLDLQKRELRVTATLSENGGKLTEGPPKTESSNRTVPVPEWLCDELAALASGRNGQDYLFTAMKGGPLRIGNWRYRVFDPVVKRAGLAAQSAATCSGPTTSGTPAPPSTSATGRRPRWCRPCSGHASVAITLDRYGHLYPGDVHLYVDRLGRSRSPLVRTICGLEAIRPSQLGPTKRPNILSDQRKQCTWGGSSVGQSRGLIILGSWVRAPPAPLPAPLPA